MNLRLFSTLVTLFVLAGLTGNVSADEKTLTVVPEDAMAWVAEREPFSAPSRVWSVIHNPGLLQNSGGLVGLRIKIRSRRGSLTYKPRIVTADEFSWPKKGAFRISVDGDVFFERAWEKWDGLMLRDDGLVDRLKQGNSVTIEISSDKGSHALQLPLANFKEKIDQGQAVNPAGLQLMKRIHHNCVQKEGASNYYCACRSREFVMSIPVDAVYGPDVQTAALENAQATCRAHIDANPRLAQMSIQEILFGALFAAYPGKELPGYGPVSEAVEIGEIRIDGPAHSVGLRTGEIIIGGKASRLVKKKSIREGRALSLDVYTPATQKVRSVRIPTELPPPQFEERELAQFSSAPTVAASEESRSSLAAIAEAQAPEQSHPPVVETPKQEEVDYADPAGTACAEEGLGYFDCACVVERAADARELLTEENTEKQQRLLERLEKERDKSLNKLAATTDERQKKRQQQRAAHYEEKIAELHMHRSSGDPIGVFRKVVEQYGCKDPKKIRQESIDKCMRFYGKERGADAQRYCTCVGEKVADTWMRDDTRMSSRFITSATSQAHRSCR